MVFPGGGVDAEDAAAPTAAPLRACVIEKLSRAATPELAAALGAACARELEEETGLSLGNPPALDGLDYLCRAVTPENRPIRFNARFFIADAALASGILAGSGELEALGWYELDAILKLDLAGATRAVLSQLQIWLTLSETERRNRPVPVLLDRGWQEE
jgi:8-oxo-dGTP pyrophosphatase MutT (NUDIX family)